MIQVTHAAIQEMSRLQSKQAVSPTVNVRFGVAPGGCETVHYTLSFNASTTDDDQVVLIGPLQLVIAKAHQAYLTDVTIDYSEDLMGGGFRFHNPQAQSTCGCGNSFSIDSPDLDDASISP
ncbi:MAG: iron-sulfur cluster assembly accessory protein [Synechococcales bacterium]|nr:iron-sulfur cluster assembly accessory protein [Synechococcales bacterium]